MLCCTSTIENDKAVAFQLTGLVAHVDVGGREHEFTNSAAAERYWIENSFPHA